MEINVSLPKYLCKTPCHNMVTECIIGWLLSFMCFWLFPVWLIDRGLEKHNYKDGMDHCSFRAIVHVMTLLPQRNN